MDAPCRPPAGREIGATTTLDQAEETAIYQKEQMANLKFQGRRKGEHGTTLPRLLRHLVHIVACFTICYLCLCIISQIHTFTPTTCPSFTIPYRSIHGNHKSLPLTLAPSAAFAQSIADVFAPRTKLTSDVGSRLRKWLLRSNAILQCRTPDSGHHHRNTTTHPESATTIRGHWQLDIVIVTASRSAFSRRQLSNLLGGRGTTGQPRAVCGLTVCRLRDSLEVCIFAGKPRTFCVPHH